MKIRKGGIYRNVPSNEFGIWQKAGFEKVITEPLPKLEEVEPKVQDEPTKEITDEPIKEVVQDEPVEEVIDELPKSKKRRNK